MQYECGGIAWWEDIVKKNKSTMPVKADCCCKNAGKKVFNNNNNHSKAYSTAVLQLVDPVRIISTLNLSQSNTLHQVPPRVFSREASSNSLQHPQPTLHIEISTGNTAETRIVTFNRVSLQLFHSISGDDFNLNLSSETVELSDNNHGNITSRPTRNTATAIISSTTTECIQLPNRNAPTLLLQSHTFPESYHDLCRVSQNIKFMDGIFNSSFYAFISDERNLSCSLRHMVPIVAKFSQNDDMKLAAALAWMSSGMSPESVAEVVCGVAADGSWAPERLGWVAQRMVWCTVEVAIDKLHESKKRRKTMLSKKPHWKSEPVISRDQLESCASFSDEKSMVEDFCVEASDEEFKKGCRMLRQEWSIPERMQGWSLSAFLSQNIFIEDFNNELTEENLGYCKLRGLLDTMAIIHLLIDDSSIHSREYVARFVFWATGGPALIYFQCQNSVEHDYEYDSDDGAVLPFWDVDGVLALLSYIQKMRGWEADDVLDVINFLILLVRIGKEKHLRDSEKILFNGEAKKYKNYTHSPSSPLEISENYSGQQRPNTSSSTSPLQIDKRLMLFQNKIVH